MSDPRWTAVDTYFSEHLIEHDSALSEAIRRSEAAGLPPHNVAPNQGKMLSLFARMVRATTILEIGTLGGYSTIWLARSVPEDGRVVTLEVNPACAEVARLNIETAGLSSIVEIQEGAALDLLPHLVQHPAAPFDLIFIDADKRNSMAYFQWAVNLSHPGTLIVADNVVRDGQVCDSTSTDPSVVGVRELAEAIALEPRVSATAIQTVGSKGYDGFLLALVTG